MPFGGLTGKVAIVTGAASGIGEGTCRRLIEEGCRVVGIDVHADRLRELREALGGDFMAAEADVASEHDVARAIDGAVARFGGVQLLVNNAGVVGRFHPVAEMPLEEFDRVIGINLRGAFIVLKACLRQMIAGGGGGAVVNVSSIGALRANRGSSPYGASKRGLIGLSHTAAMENGGHGIRVNVVCPGPIDTPMMKAASAPRPGMEGAPGFDTAIRRLAAPAEAASLIAYLLSDDASFQTAGVYLVDGGMIH